MRRLLRTLPALLLVLALTLLMAACTAPNDYGGRTDTDIWEVEDRPDTEVPNQYPDGRALGSDYDDGHGDEDDDHGEDDDGH